MKHLLLTTIAAVVLATTAFADPIHNAARNGQLQRAALLIATGAEVNAKDEDAWTPLFFATGLRHKELVALLIAKGADVNAKDEVGKTPLDQASGEIADLLRKHGGKTGEELKAEGK